MFFLARPAVRGKVAPEAMEEGAVPAVADAAPSGVSRASSASTAPGFAKGHHGHGAAKPKGLKFYGLLFLVTISLLLCGMLPVYFTFKQLNKEQEEPITYPARRTPDELEADASLIYIYADLLNIDPTEHELTFAFEVVPNAYMGARPEEGIVQPPEGTLLDITIGHQGIEYERADHVSDQVLVFTMRAIKGPFEYPFDVYEMKMRLAAYLVNETDESAVDLPLGVAVELSRPGWLSKGTLTRSTTVAEAAEGGEGGSAAENQGVILTMRFQRSVTVRFFSMFIVIMLWLISLVMFGLSVAYLQRPAHQVTMDIPALTIALMFAIPFVRDVMPEVPAPGITIDVMGYLWNMLLVAVSAVITVCKAAYAFGSTNSGGD